MGIVPLPRTFMLMAILGLLIDAVYTASGRIPLTWGIAFGFVLFAMFVAAVMSITPPWIDNKKPVNEPVNPEEEELFSSQKDYVEIGPEKAARKKASKAKKKAKPKVKPAKKKVVKKRKRR